MTKPLLLRATGRTNQKTNDNITEGKQFGGSFGSAKIRAYEAQLVTTCSNPAVEVLQEPLYYKQTNITNYSTVSQKDS